MVYSAAHLSARTSVAEGAGLQRWRVLGGVRAPAAILAAGQPEQPFVS